MGVASDLERVPPVMDTRVYRVPQFEQLIMTLFVTSEGGLLAQRARRRCDTCVETLIQQARTPIMSGIHGHAFFGFRIGFLGG